MQAVLRLLKDYGVGGIDYRIRNLFASMGGKAMHEYVIRLRPAHDRVIDLVGMENPFPLRRF